jgi:hypothetical protein
MAPVVTIASSAEKWCTVFIGLPLWFALAEYDDDDV